MNTIIGISGKKKCGKSLMADYIKSLYPRRVHVVAFADSLKEEVAQACGVTVEYLNEHKDNFRLILQGWGTDFRRKLQDDNYWIKRHMQKCLDITANCPDCILIVPDVRFSNEAKMVLKYGVLVRIERQECDVDDQHASETEMDSWTKFDAFISNNGTVFDFEKQIQQTLTKLHIK